MEFNIVPVCSPTFLLYTEIIGIIHDSMQKTSVRYN